MSGMETFQFLLVNSRLSHFLTIYIYIYVYIYVYIYMYIYIYLYIYIFFNRSIQSSFLLLKPATTIILDQSDHTRRNLTWQQWELDLYTYL